MPRNPTGVISPVTFEPSLAVILGCGPRGQPRSGEALTALPACVTMQQAQAGKGNLAVKIVDLIWLEEIVYLVVFFIYKMTNEALILSARDMDRKERRSYGR